MKLICHRANLNSIDYENENNPKKINYCLNLGYDVEIDVWKIKEKFYLGHDEPKFLIAKDFLINDKFWCHAKNLDALYEMIKIKTINCFWHQEDDFTITSTGHIWTYPERELTNNSIAVLPERSQYNIEQLKNCYGICSDNIIKYQHLLENTCM